MIEPVSVRGASVLLRPFRLEDVDAIAAGATDPLIQLWNPIGDPVVWCARRADWSTGEHASWVIADPAEPASVRGGISLHKIDHDQRDAEVGFLVFAPFRGRGLVTAALREAVAFAFGPLSLRRLHLYHALENVASCSAATSAGFRLEGVHRESYRCGDGVWHDEHSHALLASERLTVAG